MGRTRTSGRNAGNDRKQLDAQEWRARAVRLRRQGFSIREIAARVERDPHAVHSALEAARKAVPVEDVEALREQQAEEIRNLKRKWRKAAAFDRDAAEVFIKLEAREAKLLGLDAPEKKELALSVTDEQLAARLAALADAEAEGEGHREADAEGEGSPPDPSGVE